MVNPLINKIWVDADACPRTVKDILFRASKRLELQVTLVANQPVPVPKSKFVNAIQVGSGFDVADNYIVQHSNTGDLIITADIPLAAELVEKGGIVINPRGELYTPDNIRERLNLRDFMDTLRGSGVDTGGPAPLNQTDRRNFANQLDGILIKIATANNVAIGKHLDKYNEEK
ncbi:MAG: hypothetical protein ACJA0Z_000775 [Halioglobus sp.]